MDLMDDLYEQARAALDVNPAYGSTAWDYQRALTQILDLHKPHPKDPDVCEHCSFIPEDTENPDAYGPEAYNETPWPCPSAQIVLSSLGLSASTEESRA